MSIGHLAIRNTVCAATAVAAAMCMSSCQLEPYEIPSEEIYTRNFLTKFGLIDPSQNFNMAESSQIKVLAGDTPRDITVMVHLGDTYYRVAYYAGVVGAETIPFDIPKNVDELYVRIDQQVRVVRRGALIDLAASRAEGDSDVDDVPEVVPNLGWLLVAEDLGAFDDFDFNDIIVRLESVKMNAAAIRYDADLADWEQVDHPDDFVMGAPLSRADDDPADGTVIRLTAMCAGGTIPLYLHFVGDDSLDYILRPTTETVDLRTENPGYLVSASGEMTEWHKWFGETIPYTDMINTGHHDGLDGGSMTIIVPNDFTMNNYSATFKGYDGAVSPSNETTVVWPGADARNAQYNIRGFYITVNVISDADTVLVAPEPGRAPQMFLIPDACATGRWLWPAERVDITDVYPTFTEWVSGNDNGWYLVQPSGRYYPRKQ